MVKPETRARFPSPSALADSPSRSAGAPPFPGSAPGLGAAQLPGLQAKPSHSGYPEGDAATSRCAPETLAIYNRVHLQRVEARLRRSARACRKTKLARVGL